MACQYAFVNATDAFHIHLSRRQLASPFHIHLSRRQLASRLRRCAVGFGPAIAPVSSITRSCKNGERTIGVFSLCVSALPLAPYPPPCAARYSFCVLPDLLEFTWDTAADHHLPFWGERPHRPAEADARDRDELA